MERRSILQLPPGRGRERVERGRTGPPPQTRAIARVAGKERGDAPLFLHVLRNSWLKFAPGIPGTNFRQGFLGNPWRRFAPRFLAHLCAEDPWRIPGANLRPEFLEMLGANLRQGFLRNSWRGFAPRILVVLRARLRGRFARVPRALGISTVDFVWVKRPVKILR